MEQEKNERMHKLHNNYTLLLIDKDTNEIIQEAQAQNTAQIDSYNYFSSLSQLGERLALGEDNMKPSASTPYNRPSYLLYNRWRISSISWSSVEDFHPQYPLFIKANSPIRKQLGYATFSTSTGAADISKVGIIYDESNPYCYSFADIKDAEGKPIVIHKTSTQELIIYITYQIERHLPKYSKEKSLASWLPIGYCKLYGYNCNNFQGNNGFNNSYTSSSVPKGRLFSSETFYALARIAPPSAQDNELQLQTPLPLDGDIQSNVLTSPFRKYNVQYTQDPEIATVTNKKIDVSEGNINNYIKTLYLRDIGLVIDVLKNKQLICDEQKYSKFSYGNGDGTTDHFWKNLDEIVIEKSSVLIGEQEYSLQEYDSSLEEQTNEVTFLNFDVTKSPFWNKCTEIECCNVSIDESKYNIIFDRNDIAVTLPAKNTTEYVEVGGLCYQDSSYKNIRTHLLNEGYSIPCCSFSYTNSPNNILVICEEQRSNSTPSGWGSGTDRQGYANVQDVFGWQVVDSSLNNIQYVKCPVYTLDNEQVIDHCVLRNIYGGSYTQLYKWNFNIYYKKSLTEDWQLATSHGVTFRTSQNQRSSVIIEFDPISAKYWSFCWIPSQKDGSSRQSMSDLRSVLLYRPTLCKPLDDKYEVVTYDKSIVFGNSKEYDFRKVGLNFKNPPREGAEILLNATLDIPYKDDQIIMYESCEARIFGPNNNTAD